LWSSAAMNPASFLTLFSICSSMSAPSIVGVGVGRHGVPPIPTKGGTAPGERPLPGTGRTAATHGGRTVGPGPVRAAPSPGPRPCAMVAHVLSRAVIDLDGVVWRGGNPLPGAADAVARLLARGVDVVFCTNYAQGPGEKAQQLRAAGIPDAPVVTSAGSAAAAAGAGARGLVMGEPSLVACLRGAGVDVVDVWDLPDGEVPPVDVVVVGATPRWDRSRVGMVADAVRAGARFLATNDDP